MVRWADVAGPVAGEPCVCVQCGAEFTPTYVTRRKFCSIPCMRLAYGLPEPRCGRSGSVGSGRA